jgi:hypothetical protein
MVQIFSRKIGAWFKIVMACVMLLVYLQFSKIIMACSNFPFANRCPFEVQNLYLKECSLKFHTIGKAD